MINSARKLETITGLNQETFTDFDGNGELSAGDIAYVLDAEAGLEIPAIAGDRCYFYAAETDNSESYAVFSQSANGQIQIEGDPATMETLKPLLEPRDIYCNTPRLQGYEIINLNS